MKFSSITVFAALATAAFAGPVTKRSTQIGVTPHDRYSSSEGVLGCKININRVAYWPSKPDCDNLCKRVTANGRTVHVLHVDQSGGAHDISYDAWNELKIGRSARDQPETGGPITAFYEDVPMSECMHLIKPVSAVKDGKLSVIAANPDFALRCASQPNSWVARNSELVNIRNQVCSAGKDEVCSLNLAVSNHASCASGLGNSQALNMNIEDIQYGTGKLIRAQ